MSELQFTVPAEQSGKRIDSWLAEQIEGLTRSAAQNLLSEQAVSCNGHPLKKNYKLVGSEAITVQLPELKEVDLKPENIPLDIVYEDADIVVVNKPRGMVVHPAAGNWDGTLVNALMYHCGDSLSGINGEHRPGIVHRIDKDILRFFTVVTVHGPTQPIVRVVTQTSFVSLGTWWFDT